jgi:CubicO group peptidase (beta-lactamase class C family)
MSTLQDPKPAQLTAAESNPNRLKWMAGFPPKKEKIISAVDGSFFNFPALRYSVNHMREFFPNRVVEANKTKPYKHKIKLYKEIDDITFIPWSPISSALSNGEWKSENQFFTETKEAPITIREFLNRNYVDGIIILHEGKIIYERYPAGLKQEGIHAAMSVTKSFIGLLASILITERAIKPEKLVTDYLPELGKSGFAGATVQQVLNMTTAIQYSEDYNNPNAEVWQYSQAGNPFKSEKYTGPQNIYDYLETVKKIPKQDHGKLFGYKTINTEVMGWIISRVTGMCVTELISKKIWIPMGASTDGLFLLDSAGKAQAGGGFSLNLRDMALFGEMLRNKGKIGGKQIIPEEATELVSCGGDPTVFAKSEEYPKLKGWSYHNMWWITNNAHGAYMARGVHGQAIYIDPTAKMVIVRFASNPLSSNKYIDPVSIPAYETIAEYLMNR